MPDREERHLLSEDLGSGEPVSRASARKADKRAIGSMSRAADVLILAAKNLNKFRFQTNIWSAMTMVRVKCSEHNFHIASFSAEQVVIK